MTSSKKANISSLPMLKYQGTWTYKINLYNLAQAWRLESQGKYPELLFGHRRQLLEPGCRKGMAVVPTERFRGPARVSGALAPEP